MLARNISVPGFSPLFPKAHCTEGGEVCQVITGESGSLKTPPNPSAKPETSNPPINNPLFNQK